MQGNERRLSRRLQRRCSEISDILEEGDIPVPRRLGDLGSIVSSPSLSGPEAEPRLLTLTHFWHILGAAGRIQDLSGCVDLRDGSPPCSGSRD